MATPAAAASLQRTRARHAGRVRQPSSPCNGQCECAQVQTVVSAGVSSLCPLEDAGRYTPSSAPLSFSAPLALSAVVNSTNAILLLCCVSPSRRMRETGPAGGQARQRVAGQRSQHPQRRQVADTVLRRHPANLLAGSAIAARCPSTHRPPPTTPLTAQVYEKLAQLLPLHHPVDVADKHGARHQLTLLCAFWQVGIVDRDYGGLGGADADGEVAQQAAAQAQRLRVGRQEGGGQAGGGSQREWAERLAAPRRPVPAAAQHPAPSADSRHSTSSTHHPARPAPTCCAASSPWNSMKAKRMLLLGSPHTRQSTSWPQPRKNTASWASVTASEMSEM